MVGWCRVNQSLWVKLPHQMAVSSMSRNYNNADRDDDEDQHDDAAADDDDDGDDENTSLICAAPFSQTTLSWKLLLLLINLIPFPTK